jgi:Bacterial archaeo-eukaryotic release factor family 10
VHVRTLESARRPDPVRDPVGGAIGWLLILFDERRGRIFEAAPEGIVEWDPVVAEPEDSNSERRWKGVGSHGGPHGAHVAAGSHFEGHRAELLRDHARLVVAVTNEHLQTHPDAKLILAGPERDRSVLLESLPPATAHRVTEQLSIPLFAPLPKVATRFREAFPGA